MTLPDKNKRLHVKEENEPTISKKTKDIKIAQELSLKPNVKIELMLMWFFVLGTVVLGIVGLWYTKAGNFWTGLYFYIGASVCLIIGIIKHGKGIEPRIPKTVEIVVFCLILAVAVGSRVYKIDSIPNGIYLQKLDSYQMAKST